MADRALAAVAALGLAALSGCGELQPTPEAAKRADAYARVEEARAAEGRLMANSSAAEPELRRRLADNVRRTGQLLVVRQRWLQSSPTLEALGIASHPAPAIAAVPVTTPWMVKCSPAGLSVAFGAWVSGEVSEGSGDVGPEMVVTLTVTALSEDQCGRLAVSVGEPLVEIINSSAGR